MQFFSLIHFPLWIFLRENTANVGTNLSDPRRRKTLLGSQISWVTWKTNIRAFNPQSQSGAVEDTGVLNSEPVFGFGAGGAARVFSGLGEDFVAVDKPVAV